MTTIPSMLITLAAYRLSNKLEQTKPSQMTWSDMPTLRTLVSKYLKTQIMKIELAGHQSKLGDIESGTGLFRPPLLTVMQRKTAKTFLAASVFLELLKTFGDIDPDVCLRQIVSPCSTRRILITNLGGRKDKVRKVEGY